MSDPRSGLLLVCAADFGWGSLGKLRLVLDELPDVALTLGSDSSLSATGRSMLGQRYQFVECSPDEASVGLVINDPRSADALTDRGLPVVYVDSLPYLWATPEEIPRSVAVYCAQRPPIEIPRQGPLTGRHDITWVDPVVPRGRARRGGKGIVINVGGLHSHLSGDSTDAYLRLAVMPLARLLARDSYPVAAVCGNLPEWAVRELCALFPGGTSVGPQTSHEFERTLGSADTLVTSPGSTTLLQAAAIGLPTSLLPPQNLSQILNREIYAAPSAPSCEWPAEVLDRGRIEALRPAGEDAVLEYIYRQIIRADADGRTQAVMASRFAATLPGLTTGQPPPAEVTALGADGASQIARVVRQALFAPLPRPRPRRDAGNGVDDAGR